MPASSRARSSASRRTRASCTSRTACRPATSHRGARALADALPHVPAGVHWPSSIPASAPTGGPLVLTTGDGRFLVGPDNGLLDRRGRALRRPARRRTRSRFPPAPRPRSTAATCSRPAAGRLALGEAPGELGTAVDRGRARAPGARGRPSVASGLLRRLCVHVDRFGNCALAAAARRSRRSRPDRRRRASRSPCAACRGEPRSAAAHSPTCRPGPSSCWSTRRARPRSASTAATPRASSAWPSATTSSCGSRTTDEPPSTPW